MNGAEVCVLDYAKNICLNGSSVYIRLNRSSRYTPSKIERCDEKSRYQKAVFSKFRQFSYLSVFRERQKCLTFSFC